MERIIAALESDLFQAFILIGIFALILANIR